MKKLNYKNLTKIAIGFVLLLTASTSVFSQDLVCPNDIYVSIQSETNCDTIVSWIAPAAPSNDYTITQIEGLSSGSDFTPGNYTISYMRSYLGSPEDTCSFEISVYGVAQSGLACGPKNIALDANCRHILTGRSVLQNPDSINCIDNYIAMILDENLNPITDTLTEEHIGNTYMYMVTLPNSGFSCMNQITVEDKLGPKITCENDTVGCYNLLSAKSPIVEDCSNYTIVPFPEIQEQIDCDSNFIMRVTRRFYAIDEYGNHSDTCTQIIMLRRVDLTGIEYPVKKIVSCSSGFDTDFNGHPTPAVTGVPSIGSVDIFPPPVFLCNANVSYEDNVVYDDNGCTKRIFRRWMVTEWWCSQEILTVGFQTIEIVDDEAPVFDCPSDKFYSTQGHDCTALVNLPSLSITDNCNQENISVSFEFDGNTYQGNGGTVEIPVGTNKVTYTAMDKCGNPASCTFEVTVTDQRKPVAICLSNTITTLTHLGTSYVTADMIDRGSYDDCKLDKIEIRRMDDNCSVGNNTAFGDKVYFCCEDVGQEIIVILRATDVSDNFNECMVTVEVQNKIVPKFSSCPDPYVTIECTDFYNLEDLGSMFGDPVISAQCDGSYTKDYTYITNINMCNTGTINRTMRLLSPAGALLDECSQQINIVNSNQFDGNSIDWPENFEDDNLCSSAGLYPELLSYPYDAPVYNDNQCSLLGESYKDEFYEFVNGEEACFKIIRHWTVIDWCQESSRGIFMTWEHDQILKVTNSIAPEFTTPCENQSVCSYDVDCGGAVVVLHREATDICTSQGELRWSYKIDLNNDGIYDATGNTNDATDNYILGSHKIEWTVRDGCGNKTSCTEFFEVTNCKPATAIALYGLSTSLVGMDLDNDGTIDVEMATLSADYFDGGSYHSCGYTIIFSFSPDIDSTERVFDCDDLGEQDVELWVTTVETGVQTHVKTYVIVKDENDDQICPDPLMFSISGHLFTERQDPISSAKVMKMEAEHEEEEISDNEGTFKFNDQLQGTDLMIEPHKNTNIIEGVTTLDLLLIQRHILKLKKFDSPYKLIAADVNNDGKVELTDLVMLRKGLLGKINKFENNDSWTFVDSRYEFDDNEHPWDEAYKEYRSIEYLYGDKIINFIGVKIGDVNHSAMNLNSRSNSQNRNSMSLNVDDKLLEKGKTISVPVSISNGELDFKGFQFELSFDGLRYIGMSSDGNLTDDNFAIDYLENTLKCSWHNYSQSGDDNMRFNLIFEVLEDGDLKDKLNIVNNDFKAEMYLGNALEIIPVNLKFNGTDTEKIYESISLLNTPNPFSSETTIHFNLEKNQIATLSFYDVAGRLILETTDSFVKGNNEVLFDASKYKISGLVYVKLQTENNNYIRKMLITK